MIRNLFAYIILPVAFCLLEYIICKKISDREKAKRAPRFWICDHCSHAIDLNDCITCAPIVCPNCNAPFTPHIQIAFLKYREGIKDERKSKRSRIQH